MKRDRAGFTKHWPKQAGKPGGMAPGPENQESYRQFQVAGRGFTEDEFRITCEEVAGTSLEDIFEYVYTTRELDYNNYLAYAGYTLDRSDFTIKELPEITEDQKILRDFWLQGSHVPVP